MMMIRKCETLAIKKYLLDDIIPERKIESDS